MRLVSTYTSLTALVLMSIPAWGSTAWQAGFGSSAVPNGIAILYSNSATTQASSTFSVNAIQLPTAFQPITAVQESQFQSFVSLNVNTPVSNSTSSGFSAFSGFSTFNSDPFSQFSSFSNNSGGFGGNSGFVTVPIQQFADSGFGGGGGGTNFFSLPQTNVVPTYQIYRPTATVVPTASNVQFFQPAPPSQFLDPIGTPEPGTIGLMGLGLGLLAWRLRRR